MSAPTNKTTADAIARLKKRVEAHSEALAKQFLEMQKLAASVAKIEQELSSRPIKCAEDKS